MKAILGDIVLAEAPKEDLVSIEGNWYFPPSSINDEYFEKTSTPYTCPWKGEAQYFSIKGPDGDLPDRAWSYPEPYPTSFDRVGQDYSGFVAFWKEVKVVD